MFIQSELIPLIPVAPSEISAIEFLKKVDNLTPVGAAVVVLNSYESLTKAVGMEGRDLRGMQIWAVKDVDGIRTLSFLKNLGHKRQQAAQKANPQITPTVIDKNLLSSLTVDTSLLNNIKDALNNLSGYEPSYYHS